MAQKRFASSAGARRAVKSGRHTRSSQIDFSDIPESTDAELRRARRVGSPKTGNAKQLIAIRIAPRLLAQLRRLAAKQSKPYQTLIHEVLERAAGKQTAPLAAKRRAPEEVRLRRKKQAVIGLGKFRSGISDLGSNKTHLR